MQKLITVLRGKEIGCYMLTVILKKIILKTE